MLEFHVVVVHRQVTCSLEEAKVNLFRDDTLYGKTGETLLLLTLTVVYP